MLSVNLPKRSGGVELLGHRNEAHRPSFKTFHEPCKIQQRPAEPVDLIDNHAIDAASFDVGKQLLQGRPLQAASAEATVIIAIAKPNPAQMFLALNESFGCLPLRLQRIKVLIQSFLGRLAGVNSAAYTYRSI